MIKKSYQSLSMRLDLFVKLKYDSSTIILFVDIWYSTRDLLSDLNNYDWPTNQRYASDIVNDVSDSSGTSSPEQVVNSIPKHLLDWALSKNVFYFHILSFFLVFKRDFIRRADFTLISASNTASDDVTI